MIEIHMYKRNEWTVESLLNRSSNFPPKTQLVQITKNPFPPKLQPTVTALFLPGPPFLAGAPPLHSHRRIQQHSGVFNLLVYLSFNHSIFYDFSLCVSRYCKESRFSVIVQLWNLIWIVQCSILQRIVFLMFNRIA